MASNRTATPSRRAGAALVLAITTVALLIGCDAAPETTPVPTATPMIIGAGPPANDLEAKVIRALGVLGIQGQRAEHSFRGAAIWAQFDGGRELFVTALPAGTDNSDFTVIGERRVVGVPVQRVDGGSDRFACGDVGYYVSGAVPPGFLNIDDFLAQFIQALDCA